MLEQGKFVVWGSSGHAKVLGELITLKGGRIVQLFDNDPNAVSVIAGVEVLTGRARFAEWGMLQRSKGKVLFGAVAIGGARGHDRLEIMSLLQQYSIEIPSLVHPQALVAPSATLSDGCQVLAGAIVASDVAIGAGAILNHGAQVDHESRISEGVHIAPGAVLCGCVSVEREAMIGAGATVLPRISIGSGTIVGAGAVVTHDLPANVIAFGNPAKVIRSI